jgi:biofilm PGA synthesis N-glycosyltransferase PgaC
VPDNEDLVAGKLPVSVVICARNEAVNLRVNLPAILEQNYHEFEVVVVNDCSNDESEFILKGMESQYPALKIVTVTEHPRYKTGKKFALTMGIKAAKYENLLFTDADCMPGSADWITYMQHKFSKDKQLVLGYSPYERTGGLLNSFIRFETLKTAIGYLSAALAGNAYMGVGRNLAYTKSLFFKGKGFASHMHIHAGDDDLFVNQNANSTNTAIQINENAFMYSAAKSTFVSFYKQKKRHMGVGKFYKGKHRVMLSIEAISGSMFYILFAALLALKIEPAAVVGLFIFRLIIQFIIYRKIFARLQCADLLLWFPILDLIYYVYLNIFGFIGTLTKKIQWK